jgi:glucose-6-phosphate 1-epimerase
MEDVARVADLDRRFGIPGMAQVVEGSGGLPKVCITSPQALGEMYLHGAQVTSWKSAGADEALFLSSKSRWADGHAIRGGVPICFPWFGGKEDNPKAPAHGFVRTKSWQLLSIAQTAEAIAVSMFTESDEGTKKWWAADFRLVHRATFGRELNLELVATNTGTKPLRFEEALHAYYRVGSIEPARVRGLEGVHYLDKTDSNRDKAQQGDIAIVSETDRVYLNTEAQVELEDTVFGRRIDVDKRNSRTTVVWNPWIEKARALSDLGNGEWRQMICIECSNVSDFALNLAPRQQHTMSMTVRVRPIQNAAT